MKIKAIKTLWSRSGCPAQISLALTFFQYSQIFLPFECCLICFTTGERFGGVWASTLWHSHCWRGSSPSPPHLPQTSPDHLWPDDVITWWQFPSTNGPQVSEPLQFRATQAPMFMLCVTKILKLQTGAGASNSNSRTISFCIRVTCSITSTTSCPNRMMATAKKALTLACNQDMKPSARL